MTFATTFGQVVMPEMQRLCRVQGLLVALDRRTFTEACCEVWRAAARRGATMLPDNLMLEFEEWIQITILKAEDEFTQAVEERRAIADRVAADISAWEARWPA